MILSLCIFIATFLALVGIVGYRMYSKAEVEQEIRHIEIVMIDVGHYIISLFRSINQTNVRRLYHWFLVKLEEVAHIGTAKAKEKVAPLRRRRK